MPTYAFGGTPDSYVEDRDTGERLANVALTILDAITLNPVTGLIDADGSPTASVTSDASGYWRFGSDSPTVVIEVTDSLGTTRWGPILSPGAVRDMLTEVAALAASVTGVSTEVAALAATTLGVSLDPATRPNATAVVFICSTQPTAWRVGTDLWFDFAAGTITPAT